MLTCSAKFVRLSRVVAKALRHLFNISIGMPNVWPHRAVNHRQLAQ